MQNNGHEPLAHLATKLKQIKKAAEQYRDDGREYYDNMPADIQESAWATTAQDTLNHLNQTCSAIDVAIDELNQIIQPPPLQPMCDSCGNLFTGAPYWQCETHSSAGWSGHAEPTETLRACSLKCAVLLSVAVHMLFTAPEDLDDHIIADIPGATHDMIKAALIELSGMSPNEIEDAVEEELHTNYKLIRQWHEPNKPRRKTKPHKRARQQSMSDHQQKEDERTPTRNEQNGLTLPQEDENHASAPDDQKPDDSPDCSVA